MKKLMNLCLVGLLCSTAVSAADWGLKRGTPEIKSAGSLTFGPDDVLFVGDTKSASVFAIATGDLEGDASTSNINLTNVAGKISDVVGGAATINDIATNPSTGVVFVSVMAGDKAAIVTIDGAGKITQLPMTDVLFSSVTLSDVPEDKVTGQGRRKRNSRSDAITDLAFFEGKLLISGLQTAGSPSSVREISFPCA